MTGTPLTSEQKLFIRNNLLNSNTWIAYKLDKPRSTIYAYKASLLDPKPKFGESVVWKTYSANPNKSLIEIAKDLGLTYSVVRRSIEKALKEMKRVAENQISLQGFGTYTYNCEKPDCSFCRLMNK